SKGRPCARAKEVLEGAQVSDIALNLLSHEVGEWRIPNKVRWVALFILEYRTAQFRLKVKSRQAKECRRWPVPSHTQQHAKYMCRKDVVLDDRCLDLAAPRRRIHRCTRGAS